MERKETVTAFRERLIEVLEHQGGSRAAFAQRIGLDRSTLSQLLSADNERLPRTETVIAIAHAAQVSTDWLLGLTREQKLAAELIQTRTEIEANAGSPLDTRLRRWHQEAEGYKIRYVPSTLPDLLKTEAVIRYEYTERGDNPPEAALEQAEARLAYTRRPSTEMEVCASRQSVETFARGQGIWTGLPVTERREQLAHMAKLVDEMYPTFRWFLYDGLARFAVPYTIFGPRRAALYLGDMYFVFNASDQIQALARHFDDLIRGSIIQPTDIGGFLKGLLDDLGD